MTETNADMRPYRVHARHDNSHHGRIVREATLEAAAIAYVEHLALPADASGEVSLLVHDLETGHEHSFHIQLDHGVPTGTA